VLQLPLAGGCQCGKIRYEITQQPDLVYACHCTDCQHITSSAFSLGIALPESAFRLTSGELRALQRIPDSGLLNTRFICPDCSCWVYRAAIAEHIEHRRRDPSFQEGLKDRISRARRLLSR
jgi:hypothetical protein